jgi:hypothetical protein
LAERGVTPADPGYGFVLLALDDMNNGVADLDDEIADIVGRLAWLAQVPTWINRRELDEFEGFVDSKLTECEATLAAVRARWEKHQAEKPIAPSAEQKS